jgi:dihydrodipicolinate synthase/N-acetylneuraminate lyase
MINAQKRLDLQDGMVIPAMPLAIHEDRSLDQIHQKALIRYYMEAGAGGLAVGVHTTQFEIRRPEYNLYQPVLSMAAEVIRAEFGTDRFLIAGVVGATAQALQEASLAKSLDYDAVLLSLSAFANASISEILDHCRAVAEVMPVVGFYLQPAVGGRVLPYAFWRAFAEIEQVIAIKMAPFNRYQTLDVVRAVCDAGAEERIALYTGNDDNILIDLLTSYRIRTERQQEVEVNIKGGLLGHWAVWTYAAVQQLKMIKQWRSTVQQVPQAWMQLANEITDSNAAFFDAANAFHGCIAGIHEVLVRQGLMASTRCLNPKETLSLGQSQEIDRVYRDYPHLNDDAFINTIRDRLFK